MERFTGILGMAVILGLAWLFSTDRRAIKLKTIGWGLGLQLVLGFFVLRSETGRFSSGGEITSWWRWTSRLEILSGKPG